MQRRTANPWVFVCSRKDWIPEPRGLVSSGGGLIVEVGR